MFASLPLSMHWALCSRRPRATPGATSRPSCPSALPTEPTGWTPISCTPGKGDLRQTSRDVWQQYTCTAVTVPVREAEHCLSAIPVTHLSLGFMNFQTRVLQLTASAEPCLEHFPVRIHTTTGWIQFSY